MVAKKTGGASSASSPNDSYTTKEEEHAACLTYFYPKDGWKGEYGFDWFRTGDKPKPQDVDSKGGKEASGFDNIGMYVSPGASNVYIRGKFPKGEKPSYTQSVHCNRGFLNRGEDIKTDTESKEATGMGSDLDVTFEELKLAQFRIEENRNVVQKYALFENGEYYFYVNVPFVDRWKSVTFRFKKSEDCSQFYRIYYDADGKVNELNIESEIEYQKTDENGEPDTAYRTEEATFGPVKSEALRKDNVKRLRLDKKLIERIYKNEDMAGYALTGSDPRIHSVEIQCPSSEIRVAYNDGTEARYYYEAAQLCRFEYYQGEEQLHDFSGSQDRIIKKIRNNKVSVIDELLTNPFYNHPARVFMLDRGIEKVEVLMDQPRTVKCVLDVEKTTEETTLVDLEHGDTRNLAVEVFKVKGGKAKVPKAWLNGKPDFQEVDYGTVMNYSEATLVPLWREYIDENFFTKKYEDKYVFYPVPTLALVKYERSDKRRGLKNDEVKLQVQTVGKFKKVKFVTENKKVVDTATFDGSTTKAEDSIEFVAKSPSEEVVRIWAKDDKDNSVVGMMNVHVFKPIHLKICFVDISFLWRVLDDETYEQGTLINPRPGGSKWNYKKDRFLEILGQAGIIFDDIDDSKSMALEEQFFMHSHKGDLAYHSDASYAEFNLVAPDMFEMADKPEDMKDLEYFSECEVWDDDLGDYVFDYKKTMDVYSDIYGSSSLRLHKQDDGKYQSASGIDLNTYLDRRFLKFYPEYAGYLRVYVLDKCMVDSDETFIPRHITTLLSFDDPIQSPVVVFRKSIEMCDATESNPLACALLRCLGLNLYADPDSMRDGKLGFKYGTSTNMMDSSEYRYTLTSEQWLTIRQNAEKMRKNLEQAAAEVKV